MLLEDMRAVSLLKFVLSMSRREGRHSSVTKGKLSNSSIRELDFCSPLFSRVVTSKVALLEGSGLVIGSCISTILTTSSCLKLHGNLCANIKSSRI